MDGEGTIALTTTSAGNPTLRFHIYNTSGSVIAKLRGIFDRIGVLFNEQSDTRNGRTPCTTITLGTDAALRLYPLLRPHLSRQIQRYDDAVKLLRPKYAAGRQRVRWSPQDIEAWEELRLQHNVR